MALEVETGTFTKVVTPTTSQNVTVGFDPKAIIVWGDHNTTSETERDGDISTCLGFSDGTNDKCNSMSDEDEATAEQAQKHYSGSNCIAFIDITTATVDAQADIDFGTLQFTVNWTTQDAIASRIHYIVYGGSDITGVQVGEFIKTTSAPPVDQNVPTDADVRGIENNKGIVLFSTVNSPNQGTVENNNHICLGGSTRDDGTEEGFVLNMFDDGTSRGEPRQSYTESKAIQIRVATNGNIGGEADLTAWLDDGTNGFRLNWTTSTAGAPRVAFLIIKGGQWQLGNETAGTSTGDKATTTLFQPKGLLVIGNRRTTEGQAREDSSWNVGASDDTTETSGSFAARNNDAETHVGTASSTTKSNRILTPVDPTAPTVDGEADITPNGSFNATDFTLDWTNAVGQASKFIWIVCGDAAAGIGAPEFMTTFRNITEGITKQQLVRRSKQQQQEQLVKVQEQEQKIYNLEYSRGNRC